jgi:hypothetical protein
LVGRNYVVFSKDPGFGLLQDVVIVSIAGLVSACTSDIIVYCYAAEVGIASISYREDVGYGVAFMSGGRARLNDMNCWVRDVVVGDGAGLGLTDGYGTVAVPAECFSVATE